MTSCQKPCVPLVKISKLGLNLHVIHSIEVAKRQATQKPEPENREFRVRNYCGSLCWLPGQITVKLEPLTIKSR